LNPPSPRRANGWIPIAEANVVDLDGSASLSILEPVKSPATVAYFERFDRGQGAPRPATDKFVAAPGTYTMKIVNASAARVW
jgi:hypothetical protein